MIFVLSICSLTALFCIFLYIFPMVKLKFRAFVRLRAAKRPIYLNTHKVAIQDAVIDYNTYTLTFSERLRYILFAAAVTVVVSYMFFRNIGFTALMLPLAFMYPLLKKKQLILQRKQRLTNQFKDLLYSLSSSLSAGKSLETAFFSAANDLEMLYPDEDTYIIKELDIITRKLEMNETLSSALNDLARRAGIEDVSSFADVIAVCRNTGGNLNAVVKNAADIISQKAEIINEIEVITAEQKLNQKILGIMPFVLLGFIQAGSPEYIRPLYSPAGHLIMAIVLVLLVFSFYIGARIADIKV